MKTFNLTFLPLFSVLMLSFLPACSTGGSDSSFDGASGPNSNPNPNPNPKITPSKVTLSFAPDKVFRFEWADAEDATRYRLMENPDGNSGFSQVGGDIAPGHGSL